MFSVLFFVNPTQEPHPMGPSSYKSIRNGLPIDFFRRSLSDVDLLVLGIPGRCGLTYSRGYHPSVDLGSSVHFNQ
jgi:hypothetical protein